jgi:hypothetical protein
MDLSNAVLRDISVHYVGNKGTGGEFIQSDSKLELADREKKILAEAFMARFVTDKDKYRFNHAVALDYSEIYNYCLESLAETDSFHKNSVNIGKHLFESSTHPKIKAGELYVCYFEQCAINNQYVDAIGIFKTETKSRFLDLEVENDFDFHMREGVEVNKFDKGCLVFATNAEQGFDVLVYNSTRGEDAVYWNETFLGVVPQADEYYQTNQFLSLTREYIEKQVTQDFEITKTEQIDLLNKSVEYFRSNGEFNKDAFTKQVLADDGMISSFRRFEESYSEMNDLELPDSFSISTPAVKKQARVFKSVLKLDKNFHIYIHGDKDLIEKGYDAHVGKSYYKIYFDEEQ